MKQFILTHKLLCIILACVVVVGAACAIVLPIALKHDHTFSTEWSNDETNHWHAAACEHNDEVKDKAAHDFNDGEITTPATEEATGVKTFTCKTCGYKKTEKVAKLEHVHKFAEEWSFDKTNHWHAATCEHTDETRDLDAHTFGDWTVKTEAGYHVNKVEERMCSVCEYTEEHTIDNTAKHEYEYEEFKFDETNHWFECSCGDKAEIKAHTYGDWSEKTPAGENQDKQYSRKCTECQYEDVMTFDNTKTNGTYCVAITNAMVLSGRKIVDVQVLRGTITVGDNIAIDGLAGTFTVDGITEGSKNLDSASCGQKVYLEIGTEDGDIDKITNPNVCGRLAYEPDTVNAYTTFTALIKIDLSDFRGYLNVGRTVQLDLYNVGYGIMPYSLVLPEGVNVAKDGESYVVTVTLPDNLSRALWAGMEFSYKIYDSETSSYIIVARGIVLSVAN